MKNAFLLTPLLCIIACSSNEPERPDEQDEARFHEIDSMLDEEADQEKGAAPEDATPPED